jgi:hypothetical protein
MLWTSTGAGKKRGSPRVGLFNHPQGRRKNHHVNRLQISGGGGASASFGGL